MPGPKAKPRMPGRSLEAQSANAASSTSESPPQKSFGLRMMLRAAGADAPPCPSDICPPRFTARTPPSRFLCACCPHASTAAPRRVQTKATKAHRVNGEVLCCEVRHFSRTAYRRRAKELQRHAGRNSERRARGACARTARSADPSALPALRFIPPPFTRSMTRAANRFQLFHRADGIRRLSPQ